MLATMVERKVVGLVAQERKQSWVGSTHYAATTAKAIKNPLEDFWVAIDEDGPRFVHGDVTEARILIKHFAKHRVRYSAESWKRRHEDCAAHIQSNDFGNSLAFFTRLFGGAQRLAAMAGTARRSTCRVARRRGSSAVGHTPTPKILVLRFFCERWRCFCER